jgi:isoleucyl-tRNA synthetase
MNEILNTLMRLMAPILSFTAEDLNKYYQGKESVFTLQMPKAKKEYLNNKLEEKWSTILSVRENVYRSLEEARAAKQISSSLEAEVKLSLDGNEYEALKAVENILPIIFIVSKVSLIKGPTSVVVAPAAGKKCERCWMILESVGENSKHPALCKRCASVV